MSNSSCDDVTSVTSAKKRPSRSHTDQSHRTPTIGKAGRAARKRQQACRSDKRRATYAYGKGFVDGFAAAKDRFLLRDGVLSMTITRHWAAAKEAIYGARTKAYAEGEDGTATKIPVHYEFLSNSAISTSAFTM